MIERIEESLKRRFKNREKVSNYTGMTNAQIFGLETWLEKTDEEQISDGEILKDLSATMKALGITKGQIVKLIALATQIIFDEIMKDEEETDG